MNMLFGLIGGILFVLGIVCFVLNDSKRRNNVPKRVSSLVFFIAAAVFIVFSSAFKIIPTGYTGVRTTFGQVDSQTVQNGFNWKIPFIQNISVVNNKQQDIIFENEIWSETTTRTAIYYKDITVTYQINPEKSAWIYANVSDYENSLVSQSIVSSSIKASSKTLSDTDATNRSIIEPLVLENLQNSLDGKYGEDTVIINKVIINNTDFEDSYNEAIAAKQKAQLEAEQQAIINQQNIDKAAAEAQVTLTQAQAQAEAKIIEAQAEADANKLLEGSLTDKILRQMYIDKWDGKLPGVMSDDTSFMYDVSGAANQSE